MHGWRRLEHRRTCRDDRWVHQRGPGPSPIRVKPPESASSEGAPHGQLGSTTEGDIHEDPDEARGDGDLVPEGFFPFGNVSSIALARTSVYVSDDGVNQVWEFRRTGHHRNW
jgi:hypothetical protein